jgi:hypothetical protein
MELTENKVRNWTVKYGVESKVQQLLDQYNNFVSRNKIFQEFNRAYIDMQQVVEEYKKEGNIGISVHSVIYIFIKFKICTSNIIKFFHPHYPFWALC